MLNVNSLLIRLADELAIAPGVYFRCFLMGYFEGIDSERGIAYRVSDSLSLREFLGLSWEEQTPDHSTLSKTRRLMKLGTHKAVFRWVLKRLAAEGLVSGKNLGVDATTLEANAALKSIVRRDDGASYDEHVAGLMKTEGVEDPTPAERQRFDRKRKKSLSNRDWVNPHDREARITKMKDGRTHLAYKAEHAVDLETGAIVALTVQPGDRGDTASMPRRWRKPAIAWRSDSRRVVLQRVLRLESEIHSHCRPALRSRRRRRACVLASFKGEVDQHVYSIGRTQMKRVFLLLISGIRDRICSRWRTL